MNDLYEARVLTIWTHSRGFILVQGKLDQAQTIFERVMSYDKDLPAQFHYHYGALLAKTGKVQEARAELQKAVETQSSVFRPR